MNSNDKNDAVNDFILDLYKRRVLCQHIGWSMPNEQLAREFKEYCQSKPSFSKVFANLDQLIDVLIALKYIGNVSHKKLQFNGTLIYDIISDKITEFDEKSKLAVLTNDDGHYDYGDLMSKAVSHARPVVKISANMIVCKYKGTLLQERQPHFVGDELSCYICQERLDTLSEYEQHVELHSDQMNEDFSKKLIKWETPLFQISIRRCTESTGLFFTLETASTNMMLERILVVLPYTMLNLAKNTEPYRLPTVDAFFLDSSILTEFQIYPIVVLAYLANQTKQFVVEQHHFMLTSYIPAAQQSEDIMTLAALDSYVPPVKIRELGPRDRHQIPDDVIMQISPEMRNFMANEYVLTPSNACGVLRTLLYLEDATILSKYYNFVQHNARVERVWNDLDTGFVYAMNFRSDCQSNNAMAMVQAVTRIVMQPETQNTRNMRYMAKVNLLLKVDFQPHDIWGIVKSVTSKTITFVLNRNINTQIKYMVVFQPSRTPTRLQHRAIDEFAKANNALKIHYLFPTYRGPVKPRRIATVANNEISMLINEKIRDDPNQFGAVQRIVGGGEFKAPYIILGPPGSGKTTTVIEAILQLYLHQPHARILVASSTNYACDEIAVRLLTVLLGRLGQPCVLQRIYAKCRASDDIPNMLRQYSNLQAQPHCYPNVKQLAQYRIVVCTLSTVSLLSAGGYGADPAWRYTHIFVDEIQSSTLPEVLSAVCVAIASRGALIISGDHKQLPPMVHSQCAKILGLPTSLMEFLFRNDCYRIDERGNYDTGVQTRLRNNYRSHKAIVNLFSNMFYDGELHALAPYDPYCFSKFSPNPDFPIIFDAQFGYSRHGDKHMRTSWYNNIEIDIVLDYVNELLLFGIDGKEVSKQDIGIISPYKAQYMRIRHELQLRKWDDIETGSVEIFQGREKPIIIVSLVRSLGSNGLGFLKEERRLNVILSRPKCLLIMIGNPQVLSKIASYNRIIKECQQHKTLLNFTVKEVQQPQNDVAVPKKEKNRSRRRKQPQNDVNNSYINGEGATVGMAPKSRNAQIPNGQIPNGQIRNGQIRNGQIPNGLVPNGQIPNGQIRNGQIRNGQIPNGLVPNGQIPNGQIPNAAMMANGKIPHAGDGKTTTIPDNRTPKIVIYKKSATTPK